MSDMLSNAEMARIGQERQLNDRQKNWLGLFGKAVSKLCGRRGAAQEPEVREEGADAQDLPAHEQPDQGSGREAYLERYTKLQTVWQHQVQYQIGQVIAPRSEAKKK